MRTYINKGFIIVNFCLLALLALAIAFTLPIGPNGAHFGAMCYGLLGVLSWPFLLKKYKEDLMAIKISERQISSYLFFKKRCVVFCDRPVYISFFRELLRSVDQYEPHDYVMVSNALLPDFAPDSRFKTFDMSIQIIFPDTEKTRQAIAPLMDSEFCVLQGDGPPPVEELRKKKEKKVEPPAVKREKSPDDPPPFNGKWNGRF